MLWSKPLPLLAAAVTLAACQERLAAPADCPNLCPGGYEVRDTTLFALPDRDSSFEGYFRAGQGTSLRVSWQFPVSEDRAVVRFSPRPDSIAIGDSLKPYLTDSAALELSLAYRDTLVGGLTLYMFRLPRTVDSTVTFAEVDAAFVPANVVDSFVVDDSVVSKRLRVVYSGADLAKVSIPPEDSGVLALGVQIRTNQGTGVRIGSAAAGSGAPVFIAYVQVANTDTSTVARVQNQTVRFNTYVSQSAPVLDLDLITVGGAPSTRSLIRFPFPAFLKDSAQLVRATLQLIPTGPLTGIPRDTVFFQARPIIADFGGKSPTTSEAFFIGLSRQVPGPLDTLQFEVRRALTLWQGTDGLPPAFVMALQPEVSSFTRATFGSTRTPGMSPRLRISYAVTFPFGRP